MGRMEMKLSLTKRQGAFVAATADEVLFGGAAGGGKSFGQLADAFIYALRYPHSKQLVLRRTFAELEKSLIRTAQALYPAEIYRYNGGNHTGRFLNGSLIDFGYCASESDVFQYQSAEYDVIRFDELTHFTEFQYVYLISRLRGPNGFPKSVKSSTNPGGVGHGWVKRRFIDPAPPDTVFDTGKGTRLFLPSRIADNRFLTKGDPDYVRRLENLPENQRRALLEGDWNVFEGQYFGEFRTDLHTVAPFGIPKTWRRYRSIDYGLDRLACLWIAVSDTGDCYVYRELCRSGLIISEAAKQILAYDGGDEIYATLAPPDLWNRSQETGKSKALLFAEYGVPLTRASNDRETGWLAVKELLAEGGRRVYFFRNCEEVIRCLPQLQVDPVHPTDTRNEPHEITHAPDALRYFAITYTAPAKEEKRPDPTLWPRDLYEDWLRADAAGRRYLEKRMERAGT